MSKNDSKLHFHTYLSQIRSFFNGKGRRICVLSIFSIFQVPISNAQLHDIHSTLRPVLRKHTSFDHFPVHQGIILAQK